MKNFFKIGLLQLTLLSSTASDAQIDSTIASVVFPTLETFIDSALAHSPTLKAQKLFVLQKQEAIQIEKKLILRAVTLNSQYSVGNNSAVVNNQLLGNPYNTGTFTNFYSGGVFLNLSIFQVAARKNQIQTAEIAYQIEEEKLIELERQLKLTVSKLYSNCLVAQGVYELRLDALSISDINYTYAEAAFEDNTLKLQEYTDAVEVNVKLKVAAEQARQEYIEAILTLEQITGIKIKRQ